MEVNESITIKSKEGNVHIVNNNVFEMSEYLKKMRDSGSVSNNTYVLDNINNTVLVKILDFCALLSSFVDL